jgi:dienelactone hydrolase
MSAEAFDIKLDNGTVRGTLHRPATSAAKAPVVVICRGVFVFAEDAAGLFDDLTQSLNEAGLAVARFEHRCADLILEDFDAHRAVHDLEDAMAIVRWLMRRDDVDKAKIGVIGYSLGAIAATAVLQSLPSIARLCLLGAITAKNLASRLGNGNGNGSLIKPGQVPAAYAASLAGIDSAQEAARDVRPTMVLHGAADRFVAPEVALEYVRALEDAGRPLEHILVARADHTFSSKDGRAACLDLACSFFAAMINEPAAALPSASSA